MRFITKYAYSVTREKSRFVKLHEHYFKDHMFFSFLVLFVNLAIRMADQVECVRVLVWTLVSFVRTSHSC